MTPARQHAASIPSTRVATTRRESNGRRRTRSALAIEVEALRKSYGPVEALRGISFTVDVGEVVAVLGPNGAGKTTTLEILEGYRARDGGGVRVLGIDPQTGGSSYRERIGIVLQECGVEPYLTVAEVLRMHAEYYRAPRAVGEVIALVGLEEKRDARVNSLSGGQQRRLDMALGLIGDPQLLFLDEPTTGFDPSARRNAWKVIEDLCTLGKTVVLTTHSMDEAQALASRVVVVNHGEILADAAPSALGGRKRRRAEIRFALPKGATMRELPITGRLLGSDVVIETSEVTKALHRLTGWAVRRRIELAGLTVVRPSLEDRYLELTNKGET